MKIGLATSGLWKLRRAIELMTRAKACRFWHFHSDLEAIAGWGHKPTANRARNAAKARGIPYIAFEDGFLRSVFPGNSEKPLSLVMDRTGIYYDARQPSDLEACISRQASSLLPVRQIQAAMEFLREKRLSKYNNSTIQDVSGLGLRTARPEDRVLVVDQTAGDASIDGAMADEKTFTTMLQAAITENPGAEILLRIHPETVLGRKAGHFSEKRLLELAMFQPEIGRAYETGLLRLTFEPVNPWALLEACSRVYCVSSQLGFEGLMAEREVNCFGMPYYGGWGLTRDRLLKAPQRRKSTTLEALFAGIYFDYCSYFDHGGTRQVLSFWEAVGRLAEIGKT
ncbi:capsular polysaccharide export protein, LipB/KpsS family [Roseibium sp. M-1]